MHTIASPPARARRLLAAAAALLFLSRARPGGATSYSLIPDDDLLKRAPVVARVVAGASAVNASAATVTETETSFDVLEVLRGSAGARVSVVLPGGDLPDGSGARYYGLPAFEQGTEHVLFLIPRTDGRFALAELALGAFNVMVDEAGERFAVRAAFLSGDIEPAAAPGIAPSAERPRDLLRFSSHVRAVAAGAADSPEYNDYFAAPRGTLRAAGGGLQSLWLSLSAGQPLRWPNETSAAVGYLDEDPSSPGQSGVAGGGVAEMRAAVSAWVDDTGSDIHYAFAGAVHAPVTIHLDNTSMFGGSGLSCSLGVIGLGGATYLATRAAWKGDSYSSIGGGNVWMRRWDCFTAPYVSSQFQNGVTHELGHTLGLDHTDKGQSPHDGTKNADDSVMLSLMKYDRPTGLADDDREAACWLYGACTTPSAPPAVTRIVPIVLDAPGRQGARYTTELTLANRGTSTATLDLVYTAAESLGAAGSGTLHETLLPGEQLEVPDAIAYLRGHGLPIPVGGPQGGTLRVTFGNLSTAAAAFAGARTTAPSGPGRAGLFYEAPRLSDTFSTRALVYGLKEDASFRSNLALVNAGTAESVTLSVTLIAADGHSRFKLPELVTLGPGQWTQLNSILASARFPQGTAYIERVAGSASFFAYAVSNDNLTNDGAYLAAVAPERVGSDALLPVVVETPTFESDLILANTTDRAVDVALGYVESLASAGVVGTVTESLGPREQRIVSGVLQHLRARGLSIGSRGGSYAGSLSVRFTAGGMPAAGLAAATTFSRAPSGGAYGVSYPAVDASAAASAEAWVFGLKRDARTRSNLALANRSEDQDVTLLYEVFDGTTGAKAYESPAITLPAGGWIQENDILLYGGLSTAFVRVTRLSGAASFVVYGVVNDGATAASGTNDGSYVAMSGVR